jgi:hypothetical protein
MSDNQIWYGFLEAGAKSTAVSRDPRLNTGNPHTVYLFNLARGKILEYNRNIVEPELRELTAREKSLLAQLRTGFPEARREFRPRATRVLNIPERGARMVEEPEQARDEQLAELVGATDTDDGDDDWEPGDD